MKNLGKLFMLLMLPLLCVSCLVDDENDTGRQSSPYTLGFAKSSTLESYFEDVGPVVVNVTVNVLGGNSGIALPNDVEVFYTADASSTATAGNEYTFTGSSFTIPAGTTFGSLPLQINTGGLDPDNPTQLVIKLTDANGAAVSQINDTFTITFVGCQSDHAGTYDNVDVPQNANDMATITELAPNTYRISALPGIGFGGVDPVWFEFTNVCGDVQVSGWQLGTLAVSSGSVDDTTGDITFDGILLYNGSDVGSGVWFDLGATTYSAQ